MNIHRMTQRAHESRVRMLVDSSTVPWLQSLLFIYTYVMSEKVL